MTVDKNGNINGSHFEDHSTSLNDHLNNTHHFNIERNGATINIHAIDKDGNRLFTHKMWTKHNSRETDGSAKWLHSATLNKQQNESIEENMSLKDLTHNILNGNLNEAVESFKSLMAEKTLQKIEEKKKGRYDKDLDKNHNGKLDADDFKILRGEKDHKCTAACEETELDEVNKGYSPGWMLKKDPKLGQKIKDTKKAYKELKKEETDLEAQLSEVLDPSQGVKAYIDDFQKSDDPRFAGDSKEQRRKRAIAAYYSAKKK